MRRRLNLICIVILLLLLVSPIVHIVEMGAVLVSVVSDGKEMLSETSGDTALQARVAAADSVERGQLKQEWMNQHIDSTFTSILDDETTISGGAAFYLLPKSVLSMRLSTVVNAHTGKPVPFLPLSGVAFVEGAKPSAAMQVVSVVGGLGGSALSVYAVVLFVILIFRVNRQRVFEWGNVRLLRRMGFCLLGATLLGTALSLTEAHRVLDYFQPRGYMLNYSEYLQIPQLLLCMIALASAEIFAIGLRQKEELDLTV